MAVVTSYCKVDWETQLSHVPRGKANRCKEHLHGNIDLLCGVHGIALSFN
jgi:hypothetical protein